MNNEQLSGILSLVSKIHAETVAYLKEEMSGNGMPDFSTSHGNILYRLSQSGTLSMTEIARTIHRDKSTATVLVNKLERLGFVKRTQCKDDYRKTLLTLTEKGAEYNKATAAISKRLIERCYQGFSQQDKEKVFELLTRISENFEDIPSEE
ncbi:MAG: MarR family transcriptional regulator [Treponemataceae bacterium]|nr:MarR family transcriptional regulator [Treponemataceae bacterium]